VIFTTVYTPEYASIVERLLRACARHNLGIFAEAVPSRRSWHRNVLLKLDHLLACFDRFDGEDLVFLDADAEIIADPVPAIDSVLATYEFDMAMAWTELGHGVHRLDLDEIGRWHSGTIIMPAHGRRREIVLTAKEILAAEGPADRAPEEHAICEAILRLPARCHDLTFRLCHVFDKPAPADGPVCITQHQASRQMVAVVGSAPPGG